MMYMAIPDAMVSEMTNQYHRFRQWNIKSLTGMALSFLFLLVLLFAIFLCYWMKPLMNVTTVSAKDAIDSQNDVDRNVLPFTDDWPALVSLGST